jgi:hypothetical protein
VKHTFYLKSKRFKVFYWVTLGLVLLASFISIFSLNIWLWLLGILIFNIVVHFVDIPMSKSNGQLKYYSPCFLVFKHSDKHLSIHGPTLFDYWFIRSQLKKNPKQEIFKSFFVGFLKFINDPAIAKDVKITGTSYFFNSKNSKKYGFERSKAHFSQNLILLFFFPLLTIYKSLVEKKISFPKVLSAFTVSSNIEILNKKEDEIRKTIDLLNYSANK